MCKISVTDHVNMNGAPTFLEMTRHRGVLTVWLNNVKWGSVNIEDIMVVCAEGEYILHTPHDVIKFRPSSFGIDDIRAFLMSL